MVENTVAHHILHDILKIRVEYESPKYQPLNVEYKRYKYLNHSIVYILMLMLSISTLITYVCVKT